MSRLPWQVLVYPYRMKVDGTLEYALLRRADGGWWQGVAGGGEDSELPSEAAKRESFEEIGAPYDCPLLELNTVTSVPISAYSNAKELNELWGGNVYVIPQYCFGLKMSNSEIVLSEEHTEYRWLSYEDAQPMIHFHANMIAMWELHARLTGQGVTELGLHGLECMLPSKSDG